MRGRNWGRGRRSVNLVSPLLERESDVGVSDQSRVLAYGSALLYLLERVTYKGKKALKMCQIIGPRNDIVD
jgi:hypothetical protein